MSFTLSPDSPLAAELPRLATLELGQALAQGVAGGPLFDERIHELRKSVKRLRALLRLFRSSLAHFDYAREDDFLRIVARSLGPLRDAAAEGECLEALVAGASAEPRAVLADHLTALRDALHGPAQSRADEAEAALRAASDALGALRERAAGWTVRGDGWSALAVGFRETYGRGRRAYERAARRPTPRRLHALRTEAKRHQLQLGLLEPLWPGPITACRREAQRLGELLGHDHDLSLLDERLLRLAERSELTAAVRAARDASLLRHAELRLEALELGRRLYAEPARQLAARYREYFDAWRDRRAGTEHRDMPLGD